MNGGVQTYNNNSESASVENGLKTASSPVLEPTSNGGDPVTNGTPIHIPAKRVGGGHWTSPVSTTTASTASNYSLLDSNGSSSTDPLMAVSAASPYPASHYSSLAASAEAARARGGATPTGGGTASMTDTKPGLSFWQTDYHKYSAAAAASAASPTSGSSTTPSVSMSAAVAASECSQMSAAAGFAAHQAAAWNYPHPGQYAAALASPEQAAAEAARARQMAADTAGFHADYTRLQYPPDGIYSHPPGMCHLECHISRTALLEVDFPSPCTLVLTCQSRSIIPSSLKRLYKGLEITLYGISYIK